MRHGAGRANIAASVQTSVALAKMPIQQSGPVTPVHATDAPQAVELIRQTTNDLIRKCKEMVDEEERRAATAAADAGQVG